jgi:hypothetical protein
MRRVATATSIRGFDRSHILVQMFPVTLQLLRCSVGRDSAWRRPPSMGPAPHGVKRADLGFDRLGGPFRASLQRGGTAANTTRAPGACQTTSERLLVSIQRSVLELSGGHVDGSASRLSGRVPDPGPGCQSQRHIDDRFLVIDRLIRGLGRSGRSIVHGCADLVSGADIGRQEAAGGSCLGLASGRRGSGRPPSG